MERFPGPGQLGLPDGKGEGSVVTGPSGPHAPPAQVPSAQEAPVPTEDAGPRTLQQPGGRAGGWQWIQFPPSPALESVPDRFLSSVASSPRSTSLKRQQATGLSAETTRPVLTGDHPCPLPPGRARGWRPAAQAWGSPSALGGRGELVFH